MSKGTDALEGAPAHAEPVDALLSRFKVSPETGQSDAQVATLREAFGRNVLTSTNTDTAGHRVLRQLENPLAAVLLVAGFATLLLHETSDSAVIFAALILNVGIGLFQEGRASRAFQLLSSSEIKRAIVIRDGEKVTIPSEEVVVGDIVVLEAGYTVPADVRLIEVHTLSVNEASLSGEWLPVSKDPAVLENTLPLAERLNMAYANTLVVGGSGLGVAVAVGMQTEVGAIARELGSADTRRTPLQENLHHIASMLVSLVVVLIAVIFILGLLRGEPLIEMLFIAIAIAVAVVPEGLPAAVTAVLAIGMEAILRRGGLVRNMLAAETLGATTVILTDKTGTLTEARMDLASVYTLESRAHAPGEAWEEDAKDLLRMAVLGSDAFIEEFENPGIEAKEGEAKFIIHGRPIEKAILHAGLKEGITQPGLHAEQKRVDFLHFESSRRFGASLNEQKGKERRLIMTGAPEAFLERAEYVYREGKAVPMTGDDRGQFEQVQLSLSREGMRFIAVAYKEVSWHKIPEKDDEEHHKLTNGSTFVGLLAFHDPIRKDVPEAIKTVKGAGATVIMLTGDNEETARAIARDAGVAEGEFSSYTGTKLEEMDDEALLRALREAQVFARVTPEQKLRIVRILKNAGEVVAMTGDGINDAPALRSADIGVAVGSGTEVAKEASDLILLDNSFSIMVAAIEEGRRIVDNLRKIFAYMLATNFSSIFLITGSLVLAAPLPILPTQLLWTNIIEGGLMNFAFAFEPAEKGIMRRKPRSRSKNALVTPALKKLIILASLISGSFLVALYIYLVLTGMPEEEIRTIMFISLSLDSIFFAFSMKSLSQPLWRINIFSNRFLLLALAASFAALLGALNIPALSHLLHLVPLSHSDVLILAGIGFFNLATIETTKLLFFGRKATEA